MTEYKQLGQMFLVLGISFSQDTNDDDDDIPREAKQSISVGLVTFWFNAEGQFLGVDHTDFADGWEPRKGTVSTLEGSSMDRLIAKGKALWPEDEESPPPPRTMTAAQEAEARANNQSLGYQTWAREDFLPPSTQEP